MKVSSYERLLADIAKRLGRTEKSIREAISRRARKEAVTRQVAIELLARENDVASGAHFRTLSDQQQSQVHAILRGSRHTNTPPARAPKSHTTLPTPKRHGWRSLSTWAQVATIIGTVIGVLGFIATLIALNV
jgi:hypothetical protein